MFAGRPESGAEAALMIHDTAGFSLQRSTVLAKQCRKAAQKRWEGIVSSRKLFSFCALQCSRMTRAHDEVDFLSAK